MTEFKDLNVAACPFHGVDATTVAVESISIRGRRSRINTATSVITLVRVVDPAVACREGTGEAGVVDGAALAGVQGHGIGALLIDTFDDVDLAVVRPVASNSPASRY